jgi:hypothetical protein
MLVFEGWALVIFHLSFVVSFAKQPDQQDHILFRQPAVLGRGVAAA